MTAFHCDGESHRDGYDKVYVSRFVARFSADVDPDAVRRDSNQVGSHFRSESILTWVSPVQQSVQPARSLGHRAAGGLGTDELAIAAS